MFLTLDGPNLSRLALKLEDDTKATNLIKENSGEAWGDRPKMPFKEAAVGSATN